MKRKCKVYYVRGPAYPVGALPKGYRKPPTVEGGYAMTPGIPVDFWETWLEQNRLAPYVTAGMIFAEPSMEDATAHAAEQEDTRSGHEPIDPAGDPRTPRSFNPGMTHITEEVDTPRGGSIRGG